MLDIDELWVGDRLLIISKDKQGTFVAKVGSKQAQVKVEDKVLLVNSKDLKLLEDEEQFEDLQIGGETNPIIKESFFASNELDLHIEKLNPALINSRAEHILPHQISKCKEFLKYSIEQKRANIKIIHGKGTGVLKSEVHHLLKAHEEVYITTESNQGGAIDIMLQYR